MLTEVDFRDTQSLSHLLRSREKASAVRTEDDEVIQLSAVKSQNVKCHPHIIYR